MFGHICHICLGTYILLSICDFIVIAIVAVVVSVVYFAYDRHHWPKMQIIADKINGQRGALLANANVIGLATS